MPQSGLAGPRHLWPHLGVPIQTWVSPPRARGTLFLVLTGMSSLRFGVGQEAKEAILQEEDIFVVGQSQCFNQGEYKLVSQK